VAIAVPQRLAIAQQTTALSAGMVIDHSITVRPGVYRLAASGDLQTPALTIRGENITVDFNGATLLGSPEQADPDTFAGVGVLIDGGSHVTVKNTVIRGFITLISDDGARAWVDGEEIIDAWAPHESRVDRATIRGGRRKFKIEYYEIGGFAELRFDIQRR
jgi:hypothetical protein